MYLFFRNHDGEGPAGRHCFITVADIINILQNISDHVQTVFDELGVQQRWSLLYEVYIVCSCANFSCPHQIYSAARSILLRKKPLLLMFTLKPDREFACMTQKCSQNSSFLLLKSVHPSS